MNTFIRQTSIHGVVRTISVEKVRTLKTKDGRTSRYVTAVGSPSLEAGPRGLSGSSSKPPRGPLRGSPSPSPQAMICNVGNVEKRDDGSQHQGYGQDGH